MKHRVLNYNAIFQKEKTGYSVWIPSLPGCTSQGETFEEAMENIKEAISLYVEDQADVEIFDNKDQFIVPVSVLL